MLKVAETPYIASLTRDNIARAKKTTSIEIAKAVAKRIRWNVLNEVLQLAPRSRSQQARAGDPRVLVDTMKYINGIQPVATDDGAAIAGNVALMRLIEFGTSRQPARPHIAPTIRSMRGEIGRKAAKHLLQELLLGQK